MRMGYLRIPAILLIIAALAPAASAQTPLLSVVNSTMADTVTVGEGTIFDLDVHISAEAAELMGWDIAVVFDSDVIELVSVTEGPLPLTSGYTTFFYSYDTGSPVDSVRVNGAILGNTVDGPGVLFTLQFEAKPANGSNETDVAIVFSDLRTGVNANIPHDVENRHVVVITAVRTESLSWGDIKRRYR